MSHGCSYDTARIKWNGDWWCWSCLFENVGNLVCPAEFDTGAGIDITILSVPEGDDKSLKYPLMTSVCDLVLISKIDTLDYFDFDIEKTKENIKT